MQVADYQSPTVLANCVLLLSYLSKVLKYSTKVNYGIQNFWCQCLSAFVAWWHILDLFPLNTEHFLNTRAHASLMVRRPPPRLSIQQTAFKSRPFTCAIFNNLLWFQASSPAEWTSDRAPPNTTASAWRSSVSIEHTRGRYSDTRGLWRIDRGVLSHLS